MKKFVLVSLLMTCLPFLAMAQTSDDLYFIPKKKTEKKVTSGVPAKVVIEKDKTPTTVYASSGNTTVVVKDVKGELRDVDEYNRRYTSRDNTFSMENDTLYIEEKPYNERGEWVNGFEGSQSDYEYAMRIVRFRNPRYAIPVSSPLYWEVVYALPSWEWNVYDDGFYAYAFPTYTNRLWWDWRFNYSWGWHSPWYYSSWYGPNYWYGGYWGGWPYHHHHHHHWHPGHHHHPHYAWGGVGGYWGGGHGWNGSSARNPGIHAGRYANNHRGNVVASGSTNNRRVSASGNRNGRDSYVNGIRQNNNRNNGTVRNSGRVVTAKDGSTTSVRPQRSAVRDRNTTNVNNRESTGVRSNNVYTRPVQGKGSSYDRQSSTRSTVNNSGTGSSYQRKSGAAERGAYSNSSSSRSSNNRSSYNGNSRSSSSRSSYSSGSSSSRSSYSTGGGGGSSRSSGGSGGGSRSGGGGRR